MLDSLLVHSDDPVVVHFLHDRDADQSDLARLATMLGAREEAEIRFVDVPDELLRGLPTEGFTGKATWFRTFLPDLLGELDRVLALDVDLIIADSLRPLWNLDLGSHLLAAVTNVLAPAYMGRPWDLGLLPHEYFNAGVMLMNLEAMRFEGSAETIRRYAVEHADELVLRDQDALNFVLASRRLALDPRWNLMNAFSVYPWSAYAFSPEALAEAAAAPAVRHFEGPDRNKPWHRQADPESRALYAGHRRRTPWPDNWLEGESVAPRSRVRAGLAAARRRLRGRPPR